MKILSLFFFLLLSICMHAQDSIVRYWKYNPATGLPDVETNRPSEAKTRAVYYFKDGLWKMESRYIATGRVYMKAGYKTREGETRQGDYESFYENGNRSQKAYYENGELEGLFLSWYANGNRRDSFFKKKGLLVGKGNSLDSTGNPSAIYELDENGNGHVRYFNRKESMAGEGPFVGGSKQGKWVYYSDEGFKEWEVMYEKDSATVFTCFNKDGVQRNDCVFAGGGEPNGGSKGWSTYLQKAISKYGYPSRKLSKSKVIRSGVVLVRFMVDTDGSIGDVQIVQSLNEEADSIVKEVISNAPKWTPLIIRNKIVQSYHTQPITFMAP